MIIRAIGAFVVHNTEFGVLLAACAVVGVAVAVRRRVRQPYDRQLARVAALGDAAMLGVGAGMGVAAVILLAAALIVRLTT